MLGDMHIDQVQEALWLFIIIIISINSLFWISRNMLTFFHGSAQFHLNTEHKLDEDTKLLIYKVIVSN